MAAEERVDRVDGGGVNSRVDRVERVEGGGINSRVERVEHVGRMEFVWPQRAGEAGDREGMVGRGDRADRVWGESGCGSIGWWTGKSGS